MCNINVLIALTNVLLSKSIYSPRVLLSASEVLVVMSTYVTIKQGMQVTYISIRSR